MGVHQFLGEGVIKKQYIGGITQKGGGVFLREGWYPDAYCDLILVHTGTWDRTCWCERVEFWSIFPTV